jgi:hypothetical protein
MPVVFESLDRSRRVIYDDRPAPQPTLLAKASGAVQSAAAILRSGIARTDPAELSRRRAICDTCQHWDLSAFAGRGKCRQCGCSGIKLEFAATQCPLRKWGVPAPSPGAASFYHAGEIGDLLYGLYTMRALGGGMLLLGPKAHVPPSIHPRGLTPELFDFCRPFLEAQTFIKRVRWAQEPPAVDYDLNLFRDYLSGARPLSQIADLGHSQPFSLAAMHAARFSVCLNEREPWLFAPRFVPAAPVVFARSFRYRNILFPWSGIVRRYRSQAVFVGLPDEHADFVAHFGPVPYHPVSDLAELAAVIAGARLFVGNQSSPMALALGLGFGLDGRCLVQEVKIDHWPQGMDCHFVRPYAIYGTSTELPWDQLPTLT